MSPSVTLLSRDPITLAHFSSTLERCDATRDPEDPESFYYHRPPDFLLISLEPQVLEDFRLDLLERGDHEAWQHIVTVLGGHPQTCITIVMSRPAGYLLAHELIPQLAAVWHMCLWTGKEPYPITAVSRLMAGGSIQDE